MTGIWVLLTWPSIVWSNLRLRARAQSCPNTLMAIRQRVFVWSNANPLVSPKTFCRPICLAVLDFYGYQILKFAICTTLIQRALGFVDKDAQNALAQFARVLGQAVPSAPSDALEVAFIVPHQLGRLQSGPARKLAGF
ncbi:hypothetical protein V1T76_00360 [Roseibium sp. FZY0029]|uniref:hypothetical protein n=1 Tax=Roseibium sp. FZY0029 TaxID=3116647 RepID=UPI002EACC3A9|nr:hypothetical protein [Roseibium sp. FZY0029]